jgi:hypothetical protein
MKQNELSNGEAALRQGSKFAQTPIAQHAPASGEVSALMNGFDSLANQAIEETGGLPDRTDYTLGRARTPAEILADMKRSIRENWMNNFNAYEWKNILPEKLYLERIELYLKALLSLRGKIPRKLCRLKNSNSYHSYKIKPIWRDVL